MIKTFKKALAIMMTIVFVISLVPTFALAETHDSVKIGFVNPISARDNGDTSSRDYSYGIRVGTVSNQYKGFLQLDFSGYEHLLRDENSKLSVTLGSGKRIQSSTLYLYDAALFILDDVNDAYADHYEIYSDANYCMNWGEIDAYVDALTSIDGLTPFVSRKEYSAISTYTSDGNKQLVLDALDASTDDSVITLQLVQLTSLCGSSNKMGLVHGSDMTYVTINSASEDATPANYVADVADKLTWNLISTEEQNNISSKLTLPSKYLGADIEWESTNEDAVNPETGIVTPNYDGKTNVTLTANLTYEAYTGEIETATQSFDVVLPQLIYDYSNGSGTYYNGDINFVSHTGSSPTHYPKVTIVGGINGKADDDLCYMIQDASGKRRFDLTSPSTDITKRDVIEFSICVPSDCYGYGTMIKFANSDGSGGTLGGEYAFMHDGIYETRFDNLIVSWNGDDWHHVAIMAPGIVKSDADGVEYDTYVKIYVDGVLRYNRDYATSYDEPIGISYCQTNGLCPISDHEANNLNEDGTHNAKGTNWTTVACYLDNVRWTNDVYNPAYNTKSSVASTYDIDTNSDMLTVVTEGTTAKDIVDSLTIDEDATARVYDSEWNLLEDTTVVSDECVLVVADTNGTTSERSYAYYDIRVIENGEFAFDLPYITKSGDAVNGTVKLFNNSDSKKTYKIFLAVYSAGDELLEVKPETLEVESGNNGSITTANADFTDGNYAKLFIWEDDDITPALSSVHFK